jgi:hypothetical protein
MSQAIAETTPANSIDHVADAIIAMINSKPRNPTRAEILAVLAREESRSHGAPQGGGSEISRIATDLADLWAFADEVDPASPISRRS